MNLPNLKRKAPHLPAPRAIIQRLLQQIGLHPEELQVEEAHFGRTLILKVQAHRGDMPRIIGTAGCNSKALENLVPLMGAKIGVPMKVRIGEPVTGEKEVLKEFVGRGAWDKTMCKELAHDICAAVLAHRFEVEVSDGDAFGAFESVLDIVHSPKERPELIEHFEAALAPLFKAVGKANGRHLKVNAAPGDF